MSVCVFSRTYACTIYEGEGRLRPGRIARWVVKAGVRWVVAIVHNNYAKTVVSSQLAAGLGSVCLVGTGGEAQ